MNNFKRIVAVLMVLTIALALAACQPSDGTTNGDKPGTSSSTKPTTKPTTQPTTKPVEPEVVIAFRVKVVDQDGNAVPGVWVQICKESCITKMTNEEGWAEFPQNDASNFKFEDGYKANIAWMDDEADEAKFEYDSDAVTYFEAGKNEMTLVITRK